MYSAIQIADIFIRKYIEDKKCPIDIITLQKLVYLAYGWCWALLRKQLFEDKIEAWKYGPVIPNVWDAFEWRGFSISEPYYNNQKEFKEDVVEVLDTIYKVYIKEESAKMIAITHASGTPWSLVSNSKHNKEIPKHMIWHYFELLYEERKFSRENNEKEN